MIHTILVQGSVQQSSPAVPSSDPVHNPVQQLEMTAYKVATETLYGHVSNFGQGRRQSLVLCVSNEGVLCHQKYMGANCKYRERGEKQVY